MRWLLPVLLLAACARSDAYDVDTMSEIVSVGQDFLDGVRQSAGSQPPESFTVSGAPLELDDLRAYCELTGHQFDVTRQSRDLGEIVMTGDLRCADETRIPITVTVVEPRPDVFRVSAFTYELPDESAD